MKKKVSEKTNSSDSKGVSVCPDCGSSNVKTSQEDYTFLYGIGKSKVELSARIPIRRCEECGFSFRDWVADDICHDAVCKQLGVMTPSQIKGLRKLHNLTQAQFREITKLGEATLSRWERGLVIQNQAYDNYLYLLGFPQNLDIVRNRDKSAELPQLTVDDSQGPEQCAGSIIRNIPPGSPTFRR